MNSSFSLTLVIDLLPKEKPVGTPAYQFPVHLCTRSSHKCWKAVPHDGMTVWLEKNVRMTRSHDNGHRRFHDAKDNTRARKQYPIPTLALVPTSWTQ